VIHTGTNAGTYLAMYDGNGNVAGYVRAGDGVLVAQYEYGPFGELLRATGPLAREFNFLFSTKYFDWETGLYYYGHRYYSPTTGRWPNRDPIGELGFLASLVERGETKPLLTAWKHSPTSVNALIRNEHLRQKIARLVLSGSIAISDEMFSDKNRDLNPYCFVGNSPQNNWDAFGLCACPCPGGRWIGNAYGYVTAIAVGWGWFGGTLECAADPSLKANVSISVGALGIFVGTFVGKMDVDVSGAPCPVNLTGKHVHGWFVGYSKGKSGFGIGSTDGYTYGVPLAAWIPGTIQ